MTCMRAVLYLWWHWSTAVMQVLLMHVWRYTDMESEDYAFYQGLVYLMDNMVEHLGYDQCFSAEVCSFCWYADVLLHIIDSHRLVTACIYVTTVIHVHFFTQLIFCINADVYYVFMYAYITAFGGKYDKLAKIVGLVYLSFQDSFVHFLIFVGILCHFAVIPTSESCH